MNEHLYGPLFCAIVYYNVRNEQILRLSLKDKNIMQNRSKINENLPFCIRHALLFNR